MLSHFNFSNETVSALSSLVTALATLVLMATTIVYAKLTSTLAKESRLSRIANSSPHVVAFLQPDPSQINIVNIVICNVGTGPAFDIVARYDTDLIELERRQVRTMLDGKRTIVNALPPGERIVSSFGISFEMLSEKDPIPDITVEIKFNNGEKEPSKSLSVISMQGLKGLGRFHTKDIDDIANTLEKIQRDIQKMAR